MQGAPSCVVRYASAEARDKAYSLADAEGKLDIGGFKAVLKKLEGAQSCMQLPTPLSFPAECMRCSLHPCFYDDSKI